MLYITINVSTEASVESFWSIALGSLTMWHAEMTKYQISAEDVKCLKLLFIQKEHIILEEGLWNRNSMMKDKTSIFQGYRLSKPTNSIIISRSRSFWSINVTDFFQELCYVTPVLGKQFFSVKTHNFPLFSNIMIYHVSKCLNKLQFNAWVRREENLFFTPLIYDFTKNKTFFQGIWS